MKLLLFGITREIVGTSQLSIPPDIVLKDVAVFKAWLYRQYPALQELRSLSIAVNSEYAADDQVLHETAEIALLPPVSGG